MQVRVEIVSVCQTLVNFPRLYATVTSSTYTGNSCVILFLPLTRLDLMGAFAFIHHGIELVWLIFVEPIFIPKDKCSFARICSLTPTS